MVFPDPDGAETMYRFPRILETTDCTTGANIESGRKLHELRKLIRVIGANSRLFDVLDLLAELFDFDFDFDGGLADTFPELVESRGLGKDRRHFAVHFLKDEVHALPDFVLQILQGGELVEMAAQPRGLFGDVTAFGVQQGFGFETVAAIGDELRRKFGDARDQLLPVVFDKILRVRENRFQMPADRCRCVDRYPPSMTVLR